MHIGRRWKKVEREGKKKFPKVGRETERRDQDFLKKIGGEPTKEGTVNWLFVNSSMYTPYLLCCLGIASVLHQSPCCKGNWRTDTYSRWYCDRQWVGVETFVEPFDQLNSKHLLFLASLLALANEYNHSESIWD